MKKNIKKIEILAPVGSREVLEAAVFSGADAVYLGYDKFSARESAGNFTSEELTEAVKFCHTRGVKVFVALNTLFKDNEITDVMKTVEFLCEIAVDAIIVQDMGLFYLLRKSCPDMPIHCSTQMSLSSLSAVKLTENLGAKRAVLAREMSLTEIQNISENTNLELEVFVHGALCMCVSGQCYFSSMLGSRSGNRGRCAQTCRLPFTTGEIENALSLKDLGYIDDVRKLEEIGVSSAKIEGRMKRPEYVAAATSCARDVVDTGYADFQTRENLEAVFSRSGFTKGYLESKMGRDMFGIRTKEDVQKSASDVFASLHSLYKNEMQRVNLDIEFSVFSGEFPILKATDENGNVVEITGEKQAETARNKPLSKEDLVERMSKLGSTPYKIREINVKTDEISILPASSINALRREMCEKLNLIRENKKAIDFNLHQEIFANIPSVNMTFRAEFASVSQIPEDISMLEIVYLPLSAPIEDFEIVKKRLKLGAVMPNIIFGKDEKVKAKVQKLMEIGVNIFACPNLYAVQIVKELGGEIHGKYSLNILNSYAMKQFEDLGLSCAELSFEIKDLELLNIKSRIPRGLMIYGRQTLMLTRNCPAKKDDKTCATCKNDKILRDRKGIDFPVICTKYRKEKNYETFDFYSEILNSTPLVLQDRLHEVKNADYGILRFTVENNVEIVEILQGLKRAKNPINTYTRGLFYRGIL